MMSMETVVMTPIAKMGAQIAASPTCHDLWVTPAKKGTTRNTRKRRTSVVVDALSHESHINHAVGSHCQPMASNTSFPNERFAGEDTWSAVTVFAQRMDG